MAEPMPVMNNTKWEEIRRAMYGLGNDAPKWRTRDVESSYVSDWDGDWFAHFRVGGYDTIEWLEMQTEGPHSHEAVRRILVDIHVPGEAMENGFRIIGYVRPGEPISYIS
jgi:hypothetical protein